MIDQVLGFAVPDEGLRRLRERKIRRTLDHLADEQISLAERAELEADLRVQRAELEGIEQGLAISELETRLKHAPGLAQFYARSAAGSQSAGNWNQSVWERNREKMEQVVPSLISRELAVPAWGKFTPESTGLIEVVYPGIDQLEPPPGLGFTATFADAIQAVWPSLIASLLNTVRRDRAITLGSFERDHGEYFSPIF